MQVKIDLNSLATFEFMQSRIKAGHIQLQENG